MLYAFSPDLNVSKVLASLLPLQFKNSFPVEPLFYRNYNY